MKYLPILLALISGTSLLFITCDKKEEPSLTVNGVETISVRVAMSEKVMANDRIVASGFVSSDAEARYAFKAGGVIKNIYVHEGEPVKTGQLLASLDLTEINAMVEQAKQGLEKATRDYERVKKLYEDTVATLEQFQNVTTAKRVAEEQYQVASFNKSFSEIRSTGDGKVVKKLMNEGEIVGPGMPVLYITSSRSDDWVIKVGITDRYWATIQKGDSASVQIDAYPGEVFSGKIEDLSQSPDPMSGLYQAEIKLRKPAKNLAIGLFVRAEIFPSDPLEYISVPIDAIMEGNGNTASVVTIKDDMALFKKVTIAKLQGETVLLASGLEANEQVVISGNAYLKEGSKVNISNAKE